VRSILPLLLLVSGLAIKGTAQITLTAADYPALLTGTDSLKQTIHTSPFPSLAAASGGNWDMTVTTDSAAQLYAYRVPVATYQYADSTQGSIGANSFVANVPCSVTSTGLFEYGMNIKANSYSLTTLTLGPTDTLFFPAQNVMNTSPLVRIAFPATFSSSWQSVFSADMIYELSLGAFSLIHKPFTLRKYTVRKDTVAGWGTLRIKTAMSAPSSYFNVLQVQSANITTDSFFMDGAPAPPALLTLLSISQGQKDTTYTQYYFRAQEVTPLSEVTFADGGFTLPLKAVMHQQRLVTAGLQDVDAIAEFRIYPNPASKAISVAIPYAGNFCYTLSDLSGRAILSGALQQKVATTAQLMLPDAAPAGVYYLHLTENGASVFTGAVVIAQ
jgi:hypothetical protein